MSITPTGPHGQDDFSHIGNLGLESVIHSCDHCHTSEDPDYLFLHEASGERVCQKCLAHHLEWDVKDSEDHTGRFEGWEFKTGPYVGMFEAQNCEGYVWGNCMEDVVEGVLIKLKRI